MTKKEENDTPVKRSASEEKSFAFKKLTGKGADPESLKEISVNTPSKKGYKRDIRQYYIQNNSIHTGYLRFHSVFI